MKEESYGKDHRYHTLIGRALVDPDFRRRLMAEPEDRMSALREVGFDGTQREMDAVEKAVGSVGNLAEQFGEDPRAAS